MALTRRRQSGGEAKRDEICAQLLPSVFFFQLPSVWRVSCVCFGWASAITSCALSAVRNLLYLRVCISSVFSVHTRKLCNALFSCLYSTNRETSFSAVIKYSTKKIFFWIQSVSNDEWPERIGEAEKRALKDVIAHIQCNGKKEKQEVQSGNETWICRDGDDGDLQ